MPYTFYEGFGNFRVTNDLRARGYHVAANAPTFVSPAIPYGANAVTVQNPTAATGAIGVSAADPFCAQLSGRTINELWNSGGFACYWRARTWLPGSVARMPAWDGTQWVMPTTSTITGSILGTSKNNSDYAFTPTGGVQSPLAFSSIIGRSRAIYDPVSDQTMWADSSTGSNTVVRYGSPATGYGDTQISAVQWANTYGMYTNNGRNVVFGSTGSFPFVQYSDNGGVGPWTNCSLSGNSGVASVVRSPVNPDAWAFFRIATGTSVSIDNLATTTNPTMPVALSAGAASPTAIVAVGNASSFARTTAADISIPANWTTGTLPVASQTMLNIAYGNGKFVASSQVNFFVSSDDGLTWTNYPINSQIQAPNITNLTTQTQGLNLSFQNGRFVFMFNSSSIEFGIAESEDGFNWTTKLYAPNSFFGGTGTISVQTATGVFTSTTSGTVTLSTGPTGFIVPWSAPTQINGYRPVANAALQPDIVTPALGINQWHEFQVIFRPTTTANQFQVTYVIDEVVLGSSPLVALTGGAYPWFNLSRTGALASMGNLVFYEMNGPSDALSQLGPDIRIYTDTPATDDSTEWNGSNPALSNALNIATGTVTGTPTFVSEAGTNKTDQYNATSTTPAIAKVLSIKNEAYFSRMLDNPAFVQVGAQYSGINTDSTPIQAIAPVNSMNYVSQQLDVNPVTGTGWTPAQVNSTRFRIRRATNDPVTTFLCHCDGTEGATTAQAAINIGNGTNLGTNGGIITTAQSVFGGSCIRIPAGGRWDFNAAFGAPALGLGLYDFTIEFWLRTTSAATTTLISMDNILGGNVVGGLHLTPSGVFAYNSASGSNWTLSGAPAGTVNGDVWRHIAICRQGSLIYLWIAGQPGTSSPQAMATAISVNPATGGSSGIFSLGATGAFDGYVDEIRISRGCRYTMAFTPPSAPFSS